MLHAPQLRELYLVECRFPPGSTIQLFESLSVLESFTTLEMENIEDLSELHPKDCKALGRLLSTSRSLTKLRVDVTIPGSGFKSLSEGLINSSACLQHLQMSNLEQPLQAMGSLASVLKIQSYLTSFRHWQDLV